MSDEDATTHWFTHGRAEERSGLRANWRAPLFDNDFYLANNPDVASLVEGGFFASGAEHWFSTGREQVDAGERRAFGDFDERAYILGNPELETILGDGQFLSAFDHWLQRGRLEEREAKRRPHLPLKPSSKTGRLPEEKQAFWRERGYVVLEGVIDASRCDAVNRRIDALWVERRGLSPQISCDVFLEQPTSRRLPLRYAPGEARLRPYKINDLFLCDPVVQSIALDPIVSDALRWVLNGEPTVVASLNFERGSTQRLHTDTLFMPGLEELSMTAAWFALEDVTAEAGPLKYVPGSHKIPLFRFSDGRCHQKSSEMDVYYDYMFGEVDRRDLVPELFLPKKGDVLIWHERLFHGGEGIRDIAQTRKSLVCHYWRADLMPRDQVVQSGGGYFLDRPYLR